MKCYRRVDGFEVHDVSEAKSKQQIADAFGGSILDWQEVDPPIVVGLSDNDKAKIQIDNQLRELDIKSIRALRSNKAEDQQRLADIEAQCQQLRTERKKYE